MRRRRPSNFLAGIAIVGAIGSGGAARADDLKPPADPVARAAFEVLDKHCARCHQEGRLAAREKPASNFGFVLKLDQLAATPHFILPGNPYGSKLLKQILDKEMPYDVMYEGAAKPDVSETDIKALEAWIASLGSKSMASCRGRKFVSHKDVVSLMAADLAKLSPARAKGTRYLTLSHLANSCVDDAALKVFRQGTIKLVNSLSRSPDVVRLVTIDPGSTILRINIDDLGWESGDWNTLIAGYPYATQPDTPQVKELTRLTGTRLVSVRADWFAYAASRPPLYNVLLRLPSTFKALQREQEIDIEANLRDFLAQRAGFQKSGVSRNNRMIERHATRHGYFWTSYDFAGNRRRQNLFEFPLGPGGAMGFDHDGGETIFSLPNGFQAYYLNNAKGAAVDKGPTDIVYDLTRKDLSVTNGVSCMGCHDQGMRKAKDEVRDLVLAATNFSRETRDAVAKLHPTRERMDEIIAADAKRFADAMVHAGLDPTLKLNGIEMINALSRRYEEDLDIRTAAAEFGMTVADFERAASAIDAKFKPIMRRLAQGVVPRDQFETAFTGMAMAVSGEKTLAVSVAPGAAPTKSVLSSPDLSLTSDKSVYRQGETPTFTVVSSRECFLTLLNVDAKGVGTVIFPNRFQQDNRIKPGEPVELPGSAAPFTYRLRDKGSESVIAVCGERRNGTDGIRHDFTRSAFTEVENYTRSIARAIVVEPRPAAPVAAATLANPQPALVPSTVRTAIRVEVK